MKLCQSKQADLLFLASLLPPYLKAPCRNPCSMFKRSNILISIMLYECLKKSKTLDQKWTKHHFSQLLALADVWSIGMFESPKCDVNPQPNTQGIGPLVGRTSGYRRSVMHVLAIIFSITYHFSFICQYIFIRVKWSGREICPLLMYPSKFFIFQFINKNTSSGKWLTLVKTTLLPGQNRVTVVASLPTNQSCDVTANIPIVRTHENHEFPWTEWSSLWSGWQETEFCTNSFVSKSANLAAQNFMKILVPKQITLHCHHWTISLHIFTNLSLFTVQNGYC